MLTHLLYKTVTLFLNSLVEHLPRLAGITEVTVASEVYLVEHTFHGILHLVIH